MQKLPSTTDASQQLPAESDVDSNAQKLEPMPFGIPFFSFSYTSTQMRIDSGKTEVRSKHVSFDGSKLNVEQFEGQLPTSVFEQTLLNTQRQLMQQTASMFKQLSSWFSFPMLGHQHHQDNEE